MNVIQQKCKNSTNMQILQYETFVVAGDIPFPFELSLLLHNGTKIMSVYFISILRGINVAINKLYTKFNPHFLCIYIPVLSTISFFFYSFQI